MARPGTVVSRLTACLAVAVLAAAVLAAACRDRAAPQVSGLPAAGSTQANRQLVLTYEQPAVVGSRVRVTASALPANQPVDVTWGTVAGGWVVEDGYHFKGKRYEPTTVTLARANTNARGELDAEITVPEDWGGVHDIVALIGGTPIAQNGIVVTQSFELAPLEGPVGTPIALTVHGLGWRTMESTWVVNWDNRTLGWVSAAGTKGTAVAQFRAAGPTGRHIVKLYTGWQGQGYLNYEQSPVAALPRPDFTFTTTPGAAAPLTYAEPYAKQPVEGGVGEDVPGRLTLAPTQGPVGTTVSLRAEGLEANATLDVVWETFVGSRVTPEGFAADQRALARVQADGAGRLTSALQVPDDVGGVHVVTLRSGQRNVARAQFAIETSVVGITPQEGPPGTAVTIHLKGVGWTEFDNILVATYDNAYMGYACGFNSQGDVVINFKATGEPGVHLIDLYPGIYQGPPTEPQQLYRLPQLTYRDDHPGNTIPAFRFAFRITGR